MNRDIDNLSTVSYESSLNIDNVPFRERKPFDVRLAESNSILAKFPNKIPVIVEKYSKENNLPNLTKSKYLVPRDITASQFISILRNRLNISSSIGIYLLAEETNIISMSVSMGEVYDSNKSSDGFLYVTYTSQEAFGK